jgi:hypothetical protein
VISRDNLPGAVLFPAIKYKAIKFRQESAPKSSTAPKTPKAGEDFFGSALENADDENGDSYNAETLLESSDMKSENDDKTGFGHGYSTPQRKYIQVHRFLVITKERFIVLDSNGEGVGSMAMVESNHHLSEVFTSILANDSLYNVPVSLVPSFSVIMCTINLIRVSVVDQGHIPQEGSRVSEYILLNG